MLHLKVSLFLFWARNNVRRSQWELVITRIPAKVLASPALYHCAIPLSKYSLWGTLNDCHWYHTYNSSSDYWINEIEAGIGQTALLCGPFFCIFCLGRCISVKFLVTTCSWDTSSLTSSILPIQNIERWESVIVTVHLKLQWEREHVYCVYVCTLQKRVEYTRRNGEARTAKRYIKMVSSTETVNIWKSIVN